MSADDYWNGDCTLVRAYYEKHEYELQEANHQLWLQGLYIYEALLCASPVFHDFAKHPKPLPYREKPFILNQEQEERQKEAEQEQAREMQKSKMVAWMEKVNKKMRKQNDEC